MFAIATKKGGQCTAFPDVCKTPSPAGPVPIPYPNVAMLQNAQGGSCSKKVKVSKKKVLHKKSVIKDSTGDEPGAAKGVVSQKTRGKGKFLRFSMKVKAEGKAVVFQTCVVGQNGTPPNIPAGVLAVCSETKAKVIG